MSTQISITNSEMLGITKTAQTLFDALPSSKVDFNRMLQWLNKTQAWLERKFVGTFKYRLAASRIENAKRFLQSRETGSAKFEVYQLIAALWEEIDHADSNWQWERAGCL